jgi:hypothetical protein
MVTLDGTVAGTGVPAVADRSDGTVAGTGLSATAVADDTEGVADAGGVEAVAALAMARAVDTNSGAG